MTDTRSGLVPPFLASVLLAGLVGLAFLPALDAGFVLLDDDQYVAKNPLVQQGLTWAGARWALTTLHAANWHPLAWLSAMLDVSLHGMDPWGHHLTSVLLQIANTVLYFLVLRSLTGAHWTSFLAAAFFGLHPLRVESVAWVSQRKDVLSMFFALLAVGAYARYVRRPGPWRYLPVALLFSLGLASKPTLVSLPFALLLLDFWPLRRMAGGGAAPGARSLQTAAGGQLDPQLFGRLLLEKVPLLMLAGLSCAITYHAQLAGGAISQRLPLDVRLANGIVAYGDYLAQVLVPTRLSPIYPFRLPLSMEKILVSGALVVVGMAYGWRVRDRHPYVLVGWLWFLGTLVPMLGIIQVGSQARADRYTYLPSIGLSMLAAFGLADLGRVLRVPRAIAVALSAALVAGLVWLTRAQVLVWRNTESLFQHALAVAGPSATAHINLAAEYIERHDLERAREQLDLSVKAGAPPAFAHTNLGTAYDREGRFEDALREFDRALEFSPGDPGIRVNRGVMLEKLGRLDDARLAIEEALDQPGPVPTDVLILAHRSLASIHRKAGRASEAQQHEQEASRLMRSAPAD